MAKNTSNYDIFVEHLKESIEAESFIKATLSKPRPGTTFSKITFDSFRNKAASLAYAIERFEGTQAYRTNITPAELMPTLLLVLQQEMFAGHIQTAQADFLFETTAQNTVRFKQRPPSLKRVAAKGHNREKQYLIPSSTPFLQHVGITTPNQTIRVDRYDKYKQIQKYAEIVQALVKGHKTEPSKSFKVVDFGSGKNYLTFALHHQLSQLFGSVEVVGVEIREDLVKHGETTANALKLEGLSFVHSSIENYPMHTPSLVTALHACDTATDDALVQAITCQAEYLCFAPCCHKYLRNKLTSFDDLYALLRHGIIQERFCESLTDSLRVLTLESLGYKTSLFEFIAAEHTAKNTMITAQRTGKKDKNSQKFLRELQNKFAITDFYLDKRLNKLLTEAMS